MSETHAIIIAITIVTFAIIVRSGWRYSKPNNFHWPWLVGLVVVGLVGWGIWAFVHRERPKKTDRTTTIYIPAPTPVLEFPTSGDGWATQEAGLKAYLDPHRTYTRSFGKGSRYVFVEDSTITFNDLPGDNINHGDWLKKPAGEYMVYPPKGVEKIHFRWWQK